MLTWIYLLNHECLIGSDDKYETLRCQSVREKDLLLLSIIARSLGAILKLVTTSFRVAQF